MKVHTIFQDNIFIEKSVVTIGSFDGVHYAHKQILDTLSLSAKKRGTESVVVTFTPHPRLFFERGNDQFRLLSTFEEKKFLLSQKNIDHLVVLPFDKIRELSSTQFIEQILKKQLGCIELLAGYNHHIGVDRAMAFEAIKNGEFDITPQLIKKCNIEGEKISSTQVRNALFAGDIELANKLLGEPYLFLCNIGVHGEVISPSNHKLIPCKGEYKATLDGNEVTLISDGKKLRITDILDDCFSYTKGHELRLIKKFSKNYGN